MGYAHLAAAAADLREEVVEAFEVGVADRIRVCVHELRGLGILEAQHLGKGKLDFLVRHRLDDHDLVMAVAEVVEGVDDCIRIAEEVAQDEDDAPARDALGDFVHDRGGIRLAARLQLVDLHQDAPELRGLRLRSHHDVRLRVVGDEADGVLLADEHIGKRRGEMLGVFELGEPVRRGRSAVAHRTRGVEENRRAEVRLVDEFTHVVALPAGDQLPVQLAQVIARRVLAVLRELDRRALPRAPMLAGDEPVDRPMRRKLKTPKPGDCFRRKPTHIGRCRHLS